MFNIGPQEMFILFLIIILLFGAKRIPEIGRSIGRGIQEFKKGMREGAVEDTTQTTPPAPAPTPPAAAEPPKPAEQPPAP